MLVFILKPTIETAEQVPVAHNGGGAHSPCPEGLSHLFVAGHPTQDRPTDNLRSTALLSKRI